MRKGTCCRSRQLLTVSDFEDQSIVINEQAVSVVTRNSDST